MFDTPRQIFADLFALITCGYAIWRGGVPERIGGGALLVGWLLSPLVTRTAAWDAPQYGILVVDLTLLGIFMALAFRSGRWWPIFAAGVQLVGVLSHLVLIIQPSFLPRAYYALIAAGGYLLALIIVMGALLEVELPRARAGRS